MVYYLNTINHKRCGARWLLGRYQCASLMAFCTESPTQQNCPRSIRLVSPHESRIHSNHSDELPIGGMYDGTSDLVGRREAGARQDTRTNTRI